MPRTTSRISHNLPEFPYSPAIAGRRHFSALLSSSHFVTTFVSTPTDSHHSSSSSAAQTAPSSPASDPPLSFRLPPQELTEFFSTQASPLPSSPSSQISPQPSQPPPPDCAALIEPLVKPAPPRAESSKRRAPRASFSIKARGFARSSTLSPSPIIVLGEPSLVQTVTVGTDVANRRSRCRSSWRSLKRMGNRLVTPFRSMGLCMTGGRCAMAFFDDLSTDGSSPRSSWCGSGEVSPNFIRAVLENNVLLGHLTVD